MVALDAVSLDVHPGEIVGLVGRNGAGKTVLLKLAATLSEPTQGKLRLFGMDSVVNSREVRCQVGMATCDERSFYWRLTSRQNMAFFATLCGLSKRDARRRVDELLELLDLVPVADRSYRVLSTGNRQWLAIARALLLDPKLLLLDEPTNSLDPIAAARLRDVILKRISSEEGRAILITSHDLEEVQGLSHRVAILDQGRILEVDSMSGLCGRYASEETVRVTVRGALSETVAAGLRSIAPSTRCEPVGADLTEVSFAQAQEGGCLHRVLPLLVEAKTQIVGCQTEGPSLKDVFDRLVGRSDQDA